MSSTEPQRLISGEVIICPECKGHGVVRLPNSQDKRRCGVCLATGRVVVTLSPYTAELNHAQD